MSKGERERQGEREGGKRGEVGRERRGEKKERERQRGRGEEKGDERREGSLCCLLGQTECIRAYKRVMSSKPEGQVPQGGRGR